MPVPPTKTARSVPALSAYAYQKPSSLVLAQFETSLDIGPDIRPRIAMTDKGYDSQANRATALTRGITPVIPRRENSKQRGRFFPKRLYKLRARIEQTIGKLKRFKRVAMRCEKTDVSYSAIVSFACGLILVKSVHTA